MYNRYIPNGTAYTRVLEEDDPPRPPPGRNRSRPPLRRPRRSRPNRSRPNRSRPRKPGWPDCSRGSSWRSWIPEISCSC